jgi:hypothetical protein
VRANIRKRNVIKVKQKGSNHKSATPSNQKPTADAWKLHGRLVLLGKVLMISGAAIALVHWLTHISVFGPTQPPLWLDLAAGYPAGGLVFLVGAMFAGRSRPTAKR